MTSFRRRGRPHVQMFPALFVRRFRHRWSTIRYLRNACRVEENAFLAWASISEIRAVADDALNEELDKVGVPRV
jgi:hypothetical protein